MQPPGVDGSPPPFTTAAVLAPLRRASSEAPRRMKPPFIPPLPLLPDEASVPAHPPGDAPPQHLLRRLLPLLPRTTRPLCAIPARLLPVPCPFRPPPRRCPGRSFSRTLSLPIVPGNQLLFFLTCCPTLDSLWPLGVKDKKHRSNGQTIESL